MPSTKNQAMKIRKRIKGLKESRLKDVQQYVKEGEINTGDGKDNKFTRDLAIKTLSIEKLR